MNRSKLTVCAFAFSLAVCSGLVEAQTQPFVRHSFEENEGGWVVLGTGAKLSRTTDPAEAKEGKSALSLEYNIEKGTMGALIFPTPAGELAKARAFRFWIKTDYAAPIVIALQEKEGGRYLSTFAAPPGKWQSVELSPGDFFLSEDGNDPKDPNNKLDLESVDHVGILDIAQMFAQADPAISALFGFKQGMHKLLLDDFSISAEPLAGPAVTSDSEIRLDPMTRPQISWFPVGVGGVSIATGAPLEGKSLQVDYRGAPMKPSGFFKRFPRGKLVGMDRIVFQCASIKPAKLLVQLEERTGGKYSVMIDIPGGKTAKEVSVKFSELLEADDSKDSNGKLDLSEVQQLVLMDVQAWIEMAERDNSLWIGGLKASK